MLKKFHKKISEKNQKQLICYGIAVVSILIFIYFLVRIRFIIYYHLDNSIPIGVLLGLYAVSIIVVIIYFSIMVANAKFKENMEIDKKKFKELFKDSKSIKIVLSKSTNNACINIIDFLEVKENVRFLNSLNDYNESNCRKIIDSMLQRHELSFSAEFIEEALFITVYYQDKIYANELKVNNYKWFETNFSLQQ